jgi:hypothetical protein
MNEAAANGSRVYEARYANHFEVGHNEYEFVIDFGQFHAAGRSDAGERPQVRIVRIVMSPTFVKALLHTLGRAIREYETAHGVIDPA